MDIRQAARLLIDLFGRDALGEVVLRLVEARLDGGAKREGRWLAVLDVLDSVQRILWRMTAGPEKAQSKGNAGVRERPAE